MTNSNNTNLGIKFSPTPCHMNFNLEQIFIEFIKPNMSQKYIIIYTKEFLMKTLRL